MFPEQAQRHEISIHALREEGDTGGTECRHKKCPFLSTPSARRATKRTICLPGRRRFLSTPSARRATLALFRFGGRLGNFYPCPPRGGRQKGQSAYPAGEDFYPRPPRGGRLLLFSGLAVDLEISIHALREEGDVRRRECGEGREISIHALREEGDRSSSCSSRRAC